MGFVSYRVRTRACREERCTVNDEVPEGFHVERKNGDTIIRWGVRKRVGDIAAAALLVALALPLYYLAEQPSIEIVFGILVLGMVSFLVATQFNHTTIRATSAKWIFSFGPVPARGPHVDWTRSGKTVDVSHCYQVFSLKSEKDEDGFRWWSVHEHSIVGALMLLPVDLIRAHLHAKNRARFSYDLFVLDKKRMPRRVLSSLSEEQAAYLVHVLRPLLARERPASEPADAARKDVTLQVAGAVPRPAPAEGVRAPAAAEHADEASESRSSPAPREISSEDSEIVCPACGARNPQDSDFCGECGAPMGLGPGVGSREAHDGGTS
jgi:hypothetical protein